MRDERSTTEPHTLSCSRSGFVGTKMKQTVKTALKAVDAALLRHFRHPVAVY